MKHIILSCLLFVSSSLAAQTQVSTYTPGVTPDGATFFLPKTGIRISVLAEKTTYKPGEYAAYAQRYLRLSNVSTDASVKHRIIKVTQTAVGVVDTTKAFTVKFNPKTSATNLSLSPEGILLAVNAKGAEQPAPVLFQSAPKTSQPDPHRFQTEEILTAGSLAKMAQLTAQEIYELRENRSLIIKGQADFMPHDGQQTKIMLDQLDLQDRALTSMFAGVTECDTTEYVFFLCPTKNFETQTLFRFSRHFGMVDSDDLSGEPYTITITDMNIVPKMTTITKKKAENGLFYNVPGRMRTTISHGPDMVNQEEFPAGQFGNLELLSGELFNKHGSTRLWLNPVTGAIEKIEAEQPKK